jgi:sulfide dehydrogenase cytochrome subunit
MTTASRLGALASISVLLIGPVHADTADAELLSIGCNGCHGPDGISAGSHIPTIAGLDFRYFMGTMLKFRKEERASTIMGRIARGYSVSELRQIARYFSAKTWGNAGANVDPLLAQRGRDLHDELCGECHEDAGRYQDKEIPRLAGQWEGYLLLQMRDYCVGAPAMPQPPKMQERLEQLQEGDIRALSQFYSGEG